MPFFRIVFTKNEVISCCETIEQLSTDIPYYKHTNGQLIFALVMASSQNEAGKYAQELIEHVKQAHGE